MMFRYPNPPAIARALILALTPSRWRGQIEGDLLEGYVAHHRSKGAWRARLWYWRQLFSVDVIRLRRMSLDGEVGRSARARVRRRGQDGFLQDVRYALRATRKSPAFSLVIVATLAIGIGANTAIFSIVSGVLLRPLPYDNPEELAMVFRTVPRFGFNRSTASYPDFADWRAGTTSFTSLAAYTYTNATYMGADGAERLDGYRVTADLMPLLGVPAMLGRTFIQEEDTPGAAPVIVLGYSTWHSRFGGDQDIVGRTITLDGEPVTVIGVMPADYRFPSGTAFWTPLRGDPHRLERDSNFLSVIGRLAPGVTVDEAQAEMTTLAARIDREAPDANEGYGIFVEGRHAFVVRNARAALLVFLGAVALVLVVACANVANLMLSRGTTRRRELAVRRALGASPGRLTRQLLTESSVLAVAGGVLGVGVAAALLRILMSLRPGDLPRLSEVGIDPAALAFTAFLSIACGIAFGSAPALLGSKHDLGQSLKEGGQAAGIGRLGRRLQETFVVAQVALAIVLSIGAGLLVNSFARLTSMELGFDPTNVVAARVTLVRPEMEMSPDRSEEEMMELMWAWTQERARFFEELERRVAGIPGVQDVGLAYGLPFGGYSFSRVFVPEGMDVPDDEKRPMARGNVIEGEYLRAMGIPLLRGRGFSATDRRDAPFVVVVNQAMADLYWPDQDPVGKRMRIGNSGPWTTVVGVAADVRQRSLAEELQPLYYRPLAQAAWPEGLFIVARATTSADELVSQIRQHVWALNPELPLTDVTTASDLVSRSVAEPRFRTLVLFTFGAFAVALALMGIYGVIAYAVAERSREIGVRMALGARRAIIMRMILGRGMRLTAIGITLGVAGALGLTRFLSGMLFGVTPYDAPTFVAAVIVLMAIAALACYVPARRAARVDPLTSLRYE